MTNNPPTPNPACTAKHTPYQPTNEEFHCPKCDGADGSFVIDDWPEDASDCDALHMKDTLRCYGCGFDTFGSLFASRLQKKHGLVPCEHCQGKGLVPRR